jgi:hypothetical protein
MTRVAVITAVYGGFDELYAQPPQDIEADWICVTDDRALARAESPHPDLWCIEVEPRMEMTARMAAKVPKCRPDLYTDADVIVWMDGSCRLKDSLSLGNLIARAGEAQLAQFPHPDRTCCLAEGRFSATIPKYAWQPIEDQVAHYEARGMPGGWGLWATGLIVRRRTVPMIEFGDRWLAEQMRWTDQDQVSEAYVLHELGLRPADLPGNLWVNDTHAFVGHARAD